MAYSILRLDMRAPAFSRATPRELYAAALDMAAFADEKGFDLVTLSEHHGSEDGYLPSPVAMAGCVAGRTSRIQISIVALLVPLYDPVKLAEDLAVLDLASGGRVSITAGIGYREEEYAMFGCDWEGRGKLLDEKLDVLLRAWTGEAFTWRGRRVALSPRPFTRPHPPLRIGGMGRNAARRAARLGLPFQPGVAAREVLELYRAECARRGVGDPVALPPGDGTAIFVSRDPERTWAEIGDHLLHDAVTYASWQPAGQRSAVHSDAKSVAELRAEGKYLVLTPEQCLARAAAQPSPVFMHFPLCGGTPPDLAWPSLELYADEVLPHLA